MSTHGDFARRLLISVDLAKYGSSNDPTQYAHQRDLLRLLDEAGERAGLARTSWLKDPGGDSELAILPDTESEVVVIDDYLRYLGDGLRDHNAGRRFVDYLRLRLALHYGMVAIGALGYPGQGAVLVSRLVDSPPLKRVQDACPEAHLVVIVSDRLFEDVIAQGHTKLHPREFRRVTVRNKEYEGIAWIHVPGRDPAALDPADDALPGGGAARAVPAGPQTAGTFVFHAPVANHGTIGYSA